MAEVDLGAAKTFRIKENTGLMFRADAFNLFNHPNFGLPGSSLYSGPVHGRTPETIAWGREFPIRLPA